MKLIATCDHNFCHRWMGWATSGIGRHNWPRAEAHVLQAPPTAWFCSKSSSPLKPGRVRSSAVNVRPFLPVMDQNTRFLLCLHLLTAALGPLVLGESRGGVRGSLPRVDVGLHGASDAVFAGRSLAVGAVGLGGSPGRDSSFSGR